MRVNQRRLAAMWRRAFDHAFLVYRGQGVHEENAIVMAENDADAALDRYCDDMLDESRLGCDDRGDIW